MIQQYLQQLSDQLFNELQGSEELSLFLHSEESCFLRFNQSKVRQNSTVNQHEITLNFQNEERSFKARFNLTLNIEHDYRTAIALIHDLRLQLPLIDRSPQYVKIQNNGQSTTYKKMQRPSEKEVIQIITSTYADTDLAGLWTSGPLRQAALNSAGQHHFFESDFFFFDYSIYNGPLAAKGYYSAEAFSNDDFQTQAQLIKNKLALLNRPTKTVSRGQYNVYLEPMAMAEILMSMAWASFSQAQFNKGYAPLKKLKDNHLVFSDKVSMTENFNLGFVPNFNSYGELSPTEVKIISNGELKSLLTSTATANEYQLDSNFADSHEQTRSLELRAGTLKQSDILKKLEQGLYISNLHYLNYSDVQTARLTGMTRFACFWVENSEIVSPIQDLRFDESLYNIFGQNLIELTCETSTFVDTGTYLKRNLGALKTPGALIKNFNFTL